MLRIAAALIKDDWRYQRTMWTLGGTVGIAEGLGIYALIGWGGPISFRESQGGMHLHCVGLSVLQIVCLSAVILGHRALKKRYTLPISARALAGWSMLHAAATAAFAYLLVALLLNFVFDAGWPLWGPLLLTVVVMSWSLAIIWSLARSPILLFFAVVAAAGILGRWSGLRYGIDLFQTGPQTIKLWTVVTPIELATMAGLTAIAYVVAVAGLSRDRCGEAPGLGFLKIFVDRRVGPSFSGRRGLPTPAGALLWSEWWQKGIAVPIVMAVVAAGVIAWCYTHWIDVKMAVTICTTFTALSMQIWLFLGVFLGHARNNLELGSFRATQPVTDQCIATAVLKNVGVATLSGWAIWLVAMIVIATRFVLRGEGSELSYYLQQNLLAETLGAWSIAVWFCIAILTAWTMMSLGASLALSRQSLMLPVMIAGFGGLILGFVLYRVATPDQLKETVRGVIFASIGLSSLLGAVVAFVAAWRRKLIDAQTVCLSIVGWIIFCVCFFAVFGPAVGLWGVLLAVGCLALPLAPLPACALAVGWNRHR